MDFTRVLRNLLGLFPRDIDGSASLDRVDQLTMNQHAAAQLDAWDHRSSPPFLICRRLSVGGKRSGPYLRGLGAVAGQSSWRHRLPAGASHILQVEVAGRWHLALVDA